MNVTLSVKRYDPDAAHQTPYFQDYLLEVDDFATVLDGLLKVREELDGTLTLRCSCRSAICGSCAMRIGGQSKLACNTKIADVMQSGAGSVCIEPVGNMQVIKDLVVDFSPFWNKIRDVEPWLQPSGPSPEHEYIAADKDMLHLAEVMDCIMCGACVSECTVLAVDENFLGPAALAKAYRFVADPRDDSNVERLGKLNEYGGVWDCTRCMQCVEVCPKDVDPMGRIMALRDKAMGVGYTGTYGARHAKSFSDLVKRSGWLDELQLPIRTFGLFNIKQMFKLMPVAIRSVINGKLPPIIHKSIPGAENVRRIFDRIEDKR